MKTKYDVDDIVIIEDSKGNRFATNIIGININAHNDISYLLHHCYSAGVNTVAPEEYNEDRAYNIICKVGHIDFDNHINELL